MKNYYFVISDRQLGFLRQLLGSLVASGMFSVEQELRLNEAMMRTSNQLVIRIIKQISGVRQQLRVIAQHPKSHQPRHDLCVHVVLTRCPSSGPVG